MSITGSRSLMALEDIESMRSLVMIFSNRHEAGEHTWSGNAVASVWGKSREVLKS